MPDSPCFYAIRSYEHHDFWVWSAGFTGTYACLAILSAGILWFSGSVRITRMLTWIAKWEWASCCYGTPLVEVMSMLVWVVAVSPIGVAITWTKSTYDYDFTYSGPDNEEVGIITGQQFTHCKTLTVAVAFLSMAFETLRIAVLMWWFRRWLLPLTTSFVFFLSAMLFVLYMFMMSQVIRHNDDLMSAIVFLTASACPLLRIIYSYLDDLAIDLNDYLYGSSTRVLSKGSKGARFDSHAGEDRWGMGTYFVYMFFVFASHIVYAISTTWIHERNTAPGYVVPYIAVVDLGTLCLLANHRVRHIAEACFTLGFVVLVRVLVVYLAWFDRSKEKPGAYELVEPMVFLLLGGSLCVFRAKTFWEIPDKNLEKVVTTNRYDAWLTSQRRLVANQRVQAAKASTFGGMMKAFSCALQCFKRMLCMDQFNKSHMSKAEEYEKKINRRHLHMMALQASTSRVLPGLDKLSSCSCTAQSLEFVRLQETICDCEKELAAEVCVIAKLPQLGTEPETLRNLKRDAPLSEEDLNYTRSYLHEQKSLRRREYCSMWVQTYFRYMHSYKELCLLTVTHITLAISFWYKQDSVERNVFPFGNITTNNYYFEVLVYVGGIWIWTFTYGALTTYRALAEDQDEVRDDIRHVITTEDEQQAKCTNKSRFQFRPRPLSFQHTLAMNAVEKLKPTNVDAAVDAAFKAGKGMLTSEKYKIAGQAAALAATRQWEPVLKKWNRGSSRNPLEFEALLGFVKDIQVCTLHEADIVDLYDHHRYGPKAAEQDTIEAQMAVALRMLLSAMCEDAVYSIATASQSAAQRADAGSTAQIAAAIKGAEISHSYFTTMGVTLDPMGKFLRAAALDAAKPLSTMLSPAQLALAALGETNFLGHERTREIQAIVVDMTRWPDFGGLRSRRSKVSQYDAKRQMAAASAWFTVGWGLGLSLFLGIVMRKYDETESGREAIFFFGNWVDVQRLFIYSIFVPLIFMTILAVMKSWVRNNYYFFKAEATNYTDLYKQYRAGVLPRRDSTNVYLVVFGYICLVAWGTTVAATYNVTEGFAILAIGFGLSSLPPIFRALAHRSAASFLSGMFLAGFGVVALLCVLYYSINETWDMPIVCAIYYLLVWVIMLIKRDSMVGWQSNTFLSSTSFTWLVPLGISIVSSYKEWTRRNLEDGGDEKKPEVVGILLGFCAAAAAIAAFLMLARHRIHKQMRLDREGQILAEREEAQQGSVSSVKSTGFSNKRRDEAYSDGMGKCYHCVQWLKKHLDTIIMCCIFIALQACANVGMYFLIKNKEDDGRVYSSSLKVFAYGSSVLGTCFVLVFGVGFLSQTDAWAVTSDILLPVIIPGRDLKTDRPHDFTELVSTHNSPFGCLMFASFIVLCWGMFATICPDVDFLFGDDQMAVGLAAVAVTILSGIVYPIYKKLWMNYQLHLNFQYMVDKPTIMTTVAQIDQICTTVYEEKFPDEASMTAEDIHTLTKAVFGKVFSETESVLNGQSHIQDYKNANAPGKAGRCETTKLNDALKMFFFTGDLDTDDLPDFKENYSFGDFSAFFKQYVLSIGELHYDPGFLSEKKHHAVRELKTFRKTVTQTKADECVDHIALTAPSMSLQLEIEEYPRALSTLCPFQQVWNCHCRKYEGAGIPRSERRALFSNIYDIELHGIKLAHEKLHFEAHFLLSVVVTTHMARKVEEIAFFALKSGYADDKSKPHSEETELLNPLDGAAAEGAISQDEVLPVSHFTNMVAMSVMDTAEEKENPNHERGQEIRKDIFLPHGEDVKSYYGQTDLYGDYADRIEATWRQLTAATGCITQIYQSVEVMSEFLGKKCKPATMGALNCEHTGRTLNTQVEIVSESEWTALFGGVGSETGTVMDVYEKAKSLKESWDRVMNGPDEKVPGCFNKLKSPLVYISAIMLEYYELSLFVSMYATGEARYTSFNQIRDSSVSFRVYSDKMLKACHNSGNQFVSAGGKLDARALTQLFQPVNAMLEAFEFACHAVVAEEEPEHGPSLLREAFLLLRAEVTFDIVFSMFSDRDQVSADELSHWLDRLAQQDELVWEKKSDEARLASKQPLSKEEFHQLHQRLVFGKGGYREGVLCIKGAHCHDWEAMLNSIKKDFCSKRSETEFQQRLEQHSNYQMYKWLEETTIMVDEVFNSCFYFRVASYLRHFRHTESAIQSEPPEQMFRDYKKQMDDRLNSPQMQQLLTMTRDPANKAMPGYCYKQDKYFKAFIKLLGEDAHIRRDYAALYRVSRVLDLSKTDADFKSGKSKNTLRMKQQLLSQLGDALGCDEHEETQIRSANRIVFPEDKSGGTEPQRIQVSHLLEGNALYKQIMEEDERLRTGSSLDMRQDVSLKSSTRTTLETPGMVDANAGKGGGKGMVDASAGQGSGNGMVVEFEPLGNQSDEACGSGVLLEETSYDSHGAAVPYDEPTMDTHNEKGFCGLGSQSVSSLTGSGNGSSAEIDFAITGSGNGVDTNYGSEESIHEPMYLHLLDTMMVGTRKIEVNFGSVNDRAESRQTNPMANNQDVQDEPEPDQVTVDVSQVSKANLSTNLPLDVVRVCMILPLSTVNDIDMDFSMLPNPPQLPIKKALVIRGDRLIRGERKRKTCIIVARNDQEHRLLLETLSSVSRYDPAEADEDKNMHTSFTSRAGGVQLQPVPAMGNVQLI